MATKQEFFDALTRVGKLAVSQDPLANYGRFYEPLRGLERDAMFAKAREVVAAFSTEFAKEVELIPGAYWNNQPDEESPTRGFNYIGDGHEMSVGVDLPPYWGSFCFMRHGHLGISLHHMGVGVEYENVLEMPEHKALLAMIGPVPVKSLILGSWGERDDSQSEGKEMEVSGLTFSDFFAGYNPHVGAFPVNRRQLFGAYLDSWQPFRGPSTPADFSDLTKNLTFYFNTGEDDRRCLQSSLAVAAPEVYELLRQQLLTLYRELVLQSGAPMDFEEGPFYVTSANLFNAHRPTDHWSKQCLIETRRGPRAFPFSCSVHFDGDAYWRKKVDVALESVSVSYENVGSDGTEIEGIVTGLSQRFV